MLTKSINYDGSPLIWPLPNECHRKEGTFVIEDKLSLSFSSCFKSEVELLIPLLEAEGLIVDVLEYDGNIQLIKCFNDSINDEGYILNVMTDGIKLNANTCKGIFYGFQSLVQLIINSYDKKIPCVSIADSPFKPVRGVHLYTPSRGNLAWFKRYVDFLSKYKYNTMFIEVSAAMKYDSHPEINEAWVDFCNKIETMGEGSENSIQRAVGHFKNSVHPENGGGQYLEKAEFSELIDYIKKRHIDVIPELQGLSHSYWMLMAHRECAEREDDPYPDTYCPSNPATYEIYFDCLQEILDVFKPATVHIGHDEYYTIGFCEKCRGKAGQDILAGDIIKIHDWLAERNVKTAMWSDKLSEYTASDGKLEGGVERLQFNRRTGKNELMRSTFRAVDMIPSDILMIDWHHSLSGEGIEDMEDTKSQDYFYRRGMDVIFGNLYGKLDHLGFKNIEDRLRRPNVFGAECSHWREASDMGMALNDQLVRCLEVANVLWYEGYTLKKGYLLNNIIAQLYPLERDKLNGSCSAMWDTDGFEQIDISNYYNMTLNGTAICDFILSTEKLPNTIPFEICRNVEDKANDAAGILAGHGKVDRIEGIIVGGRFRSIAFLHSYSIGNPVCHSGFDENPAKDVVGYYIVQYSDGNSVKIPIEYGRTIVSVDNSFGAYWSNPVFQSLKVEEEEKELITSKAVIVKTSARVVFSYEWKNPYPDKEIKSIAIEHDTQKNGGIIVFGITAIR